MGCVISWFSHTVVFARAEYDPLRPSVEAVLDSSRYFVVRVEGEGKKAYIGLGFAERTDSFDFSESLQPFSVTWHETNFYRCCTPRLYQVCSLLCENIFGSLILNPYRRHKAALNPITSSDEPSPHIPTGPRKDYSLKEGQTFSISIPGRVKVTAGNSLLGSTSQSTTTSTSSAVPLLPPPPSTKRRWRLYNILVVSSVLNITRSLPGDIWGGWLVLRQLTPISLNVIFWLINWMLSRMGYEILMLAGSYNAPSLFWVWGVCKT